MAERPLGANAVCDATRTPGRVAKFVGRWRCTRLLSRGAGDRRRGRKRDPAGVDGGLDLQTGGQGGRWGQSRSISNLAPTLSLAGWQDRFASMSWMVGIM